MNIIGINGFKRSGKGETGKAISELLLGVKCLGFADKLKIVAARSLGFGEGYTDEQRIKLMDEAKECWLLDVSKIGEPGHNFAGLANTRRLRGLTVRQYLQNLGNDARLVFGEDFWVDQVLPSPVDTSIPGWDCIEDVELEQRYPGVETLVFTDLRYPNEAKRIQDLGGFNIEVVNPRTSSDGHASEQPLPEDLINYQIINDLGLSDLRWEVEKVLEILGLKS